MLLLMHWLSCRLGTAEGNFSSAIQVTGFKRILETQNILKVYTRKVFCQRYQLEIQARSNDEFTFKYESFGFWYKRNNNSIENMPFCFLIC